MGNKAKGRISKRVLQENKARQTFRKTNISYPLICTRRCAYHGVRNVCFSKNLACFVFLEHPFWNSPFCLITDVFIYSQEIFLISSQLQYNKWLREKLYKMSFWEREKLRVQNISVVNTVKRNEVFH